MKVRILRSAMDDLENGWTFYERQSPGLGDYFFDSLASDIDSLSLFGGIHRIVHGFHRALSKRFPYAIYYRVEENTALIFRVLDCRRHPQEISHELGGID
jgi:plasmid stabilization system protein ParE